MRTSEGDAMPSMANRPEAAPSFHEPLQARGGRASLMGAKTTRVSRREAGAPPAPLAERILLLDRDTEHLRRLTQYLTGHGYRVSSIQDPTELPVRLQLEAPDLILLEQHLGDVTGTEVLSRIRAVSGVPVIILTAMSDPVDRIINLEMGADDQVHKSVPQREIMARMRAVLRRMRPAAELPRYTWALSETRRDVIRTDGTPCGLTTAEFGVLQELANAGGTAVSRADLCHRVFGRPLHPGDRAVDTVICKLRQKLGSGVIVTVRPAGYAFAGFPTAAPG